MTSSKFQTVESVVSCAAGPILVVSTVVGRGMYTLAEAVIQRFPKNVEVHHIAIEDYVSPEVVQEDLKRYKWISSRFPILLHLVYRIPLFYMRKYLRERAFKSSNLSALGKKIDEVNPATVVCVSHRPAFWVGNLKNRRGLSFKLWGLLGEYGKNLGWRYQFWSEFDLFLSPVDREELGFSLNPAVDFRKIELPARLEYLELADRPGRRDQILLVCGYWGQGPLEKILRSLLLTHPKIHVHVVCGENEKVFRRLQTQFEDHPRVSVSGVVDSLVPYLRECGSVITKPGISTLLEAQAAARKIFLIPGMPVAEDNNARYARQEFHAIDFSLSSFQEWYSRAAER